MKKFDITRVGFLNSAAPEESLKRLARAAATNGVTEGSILTLMRLTHFAHGITRQLDSIPEWDLEELKSLKLIHAMSDTEIKLV